MYLLYYSLFLYNVFNDKTSEIGFDNFFKYMQKKYKEGTNESECRGVFKKLLT